MPNDIQDGSSGGDDENGGEPTPEPERETGGGATLAPEGGDPFDPDDKGPWTAHGVAIPADATTYGKSKKKTYWPSDVVKEGADELADRHLIKNHPDDPGIEDIIGQITDHEFIEGLGLAWQGEIDDRETAKKVSRGRVQASPYLFRLLGERSDEHDARKAKRILKIRDLGIVREGAGDQFGEKTGVEAGPHPELNPENGETAEALAAAFDPEQHDTTGDDPAAPASTVETAESGDSTMTNGESADDGEEQLRKRISELEDENDRLESENEQAREGFAEALEAGSRFDAKTLTEKFTLEELRDHADAQGDGDGLTIEPVSGGTPDEQNPGTDSEVGAEALSADEQDELESLEKQADLFRGRDGMEEYVETIESEMSALTGNGGDP